MRGNLAGPGRMAVVNKRQAMRIEKKLRSRSPWWEIYTIKTLKAAVDRMNTAWLTERVSSIQYGKKCWSITPAFYIRNRLESFMIRQGALKELLKEKDNGRN